MHRNPVTGLITKMVVTLIGVLVIIAGLVMMVAPGPGILGLLFGLAILSTEWRWADRWLDAARAAAHRAAEKARQIDPAVRRRQIALGVLAVVLTALVVGLLVDLLGWPELALDGWDWMQGIVTVLPDLPGE
ncbi:PGPGW domain-containing protein [Nocardioides sp. Y6]|uniref:PGPGW domain-containing protein n=1 Tax=Nocardioides malaquae TaxID=2773426 RepID=A0ABR9RVI9_9ACTN|nr:PGPGW domain-containing protein [Nocardioides malaquae]